MKVIDVANFIYEEYLKETNEVIDEMKLHKLLYFAQRESLAITGKPLFEESFEGWKYGPVVKEVRNAFTPDGMHADIHDLSDDEIYLLKNVILEYGQYSSWKLSQMTHNEISWLNSRKGMPTCSIGNRPLLLGDIMKDAEKVRPYDHVWDMYYDEFEDA